MYVHFLTYVVFVALVVLSVIDVCVLLFKNVHCHESKNPDFPENRPSGFLLENFRFFLKCSR